MLFDIIFPAFDEVVFFDNKIDEGLFPLHNNLIGKNQRLLPIF